MAANNMTRHPNPTPKKSNSSKKNKEVRQEADPSRHDNEKIAWGFSAADLDGPWGWKIRAGKNWWHQIFPALKSFESMTWAEIMKASGGRKKGNNHHPVKVKELTKIAQNRLSEIKQDDVSELFSLRLNGTHRIYGIRDCRVLKLIWYDQNHGDNTKAVFPVRKP